MLASEESGYCVDGLELSNATISRSDGQANAPVLEVSGFHVDTSLAGHGVDGPAEVVSTWLPGGASSKSK